MSCIFAEECAYGNPDALCEDCEYNEPAHNTVEENWREYEETCRRVQQNTYDEHVYIEKRREQNGEGF